METTNNDPPPSGIFSDMENHICASYRFFWDDFIDDSKLGKEAKP